MNSITARDLKRIRTLAQFRYSLRQFLQFSERRAEEAGLHPQQYLLLLQIAGAPRGAATTVSYAAERLGLRHHSVVELTTRCEESHLLRRVHDAEDRRKVLLEVTPEGERVLNTLAADHERELRELLPRLFESMASIQQSQSSKTPRRSRQPNADRVKSAVLTQSAAPRIVLANLHSA